MGCDVWTNYFMQIVCASVEAGDEAKLFSSGVQKDLSALYIDLFERFQAVLHERRTDYGNLLYAFRRKLLQPFCRVRREPACVSEPALEAHFYLRSRERSVFEQESVLLFALVLIVFLLYASVHIDMGKRYAVV